MEIFCYVLRKGLHLQTRTELLIHPAAIGQVVRVWSQRPLEGIQAMEHLEAVCQGSGKISGGATCAGMCEAASASQFGRPGFKSSGAFWSFPVLSMAEWVPCRYPWRSLIGLLWSAGCWPDSSPADSRAGSSWWWFPDSSFSTNCLRVLSSPHPPCS
ncbi:uncharacterized protein LOC133503489 isoform X2 [Syngnathoides biaculeatus]|uniref:uncharacterized protein LOC133503489 isoform X2 n=1 Tax=Syngnathoides biaculeatus TaxID=300417 RepID=UPI002ADD43C6|nr:uncharacterized protein LOC133503489 isoform X2 [Syngnathoides biaculeatus]